MITEFGSLGSTSRPALSAVPPAAVDRPIRGEITGEELIVSVHTAERIGARCPDQGVVGGSAGQDVVVLPPRGKLLTAVELTTLSARSPALIWTRALAAAVRGVVAASSASRADVHPEPV